MSNKASVILIGYATCKSPIGTPDLQVEDEAATNRVGPQTSLCYRCVPFFELRVAVAVAGIEEDGNTSLPGDFGFDPLGLSDPEGTGGFIEPRWLAYGEVINGRFAMLGAAGAIAPEIFGKLGLIPAETALPWFQTGVIPPAGTYSYWADPYTLFVMEMALMGFAEHRRFQDWYNPGSMGKQYFLGLEKGFSGSGNPAYPGGPFFNPLGFGKDEKSMKELKLKEIKNGRLAMLAVLGYFIQGLVTGVGPYQNLLDHLADPVNNNVLTSLKFH
ncbi:hypothetical protein Ccrd_012865 [Cynara cardunculus var. scolymus]|uniref:Chlorophyll a-b binding protein, chloroplastic n=1 Tax=Cynara cardunculus var. scolymus TaxID=59895 RepID=A0A103YGM7_CYNCS|nr:hypothetical protein Ccrd_012865 [Cynara cardunculus var. scolymus]